MKTYTNIFIICLALFLGFNSQAESNVTIKVRAINPLEEEAPVTIHYPLPAGVTPEDVLAKRLGRGKGATRPADFQINLDEKENVYYIDHEITLAPKEIVVLEVEARDVWTIPQATIDELKMRVENLVKTQPVSPEGAVDPVAAKLKDTIFRQLEQVAKAQKENAITQVGVEAHMKAHQKSRATLQQVQMDIAMLENMIAAQKEEPAPPEGTAPASEDTEPVPADAVPATEGVGTNVQTPSPSPEVPAAAPQEQKKSVRDKLRSLFKWK